MDKNTQKDTNSDEEVIPLSEILGTKDKNDEEESPLNDKQKVLYAIAIASFVAFIIFANSGSGFDKIFFSLNTIKRAGGYITDWTPRLETIIPFVIALLCGVMGKMFSNDKK